jgi:hypothetical protein
MSEALDRQLNGWSLVAREKLVRVFDGFEEAAIYAAKNFPDEQVLIRNTSEQRGMVPFIVAARKSR